MFITIMKASCYVVLLLLSFLLFTAVRFYIRYTTNTTIITTTTTTNTTFYFTILLLLRNRTSNTIAYNQIYNISTPSSFSSSSSSSSFSSSSSSLSSLPWLPLKLRHHNHTIASHDKRRATLYSCPSPHSISPVAAADTPGEKRQVSRISRPV